MTYNTTCEVTENSGILTIDISCSGKITNKLQQPYSVDNDLDVWIKENPIEADFDINAWFEESLIEIEKRFLLGIKAVFPVIDIEYFSNQLILTGEVQKFSPESKHIKANIRLDIPRDFNYVLTLINYIDKLMKDLDYTLFGLYGYAYVSFNLKHDKVTTSKYPSLKGFCRELKRHLVFSVFKEKEEPPLLYTNVYHNFNKFRNELERSMKDDADRLPLFADKMLEDYQFDISTWQCLSSSEKISDLRKLATRIKNESNTDDVDFLLNYIPFKIRCAFFSPALNLKKFPNANEHITFQTIFTNADLTLRTDGRLSISISEDLKNKLTLYYFHYHPPLDLSHKLRAPAEQDADKIKINIAKESELDKEIIFTPDSSQKMISLGMHLHADYIIKEHFLALKEIRTNTRATAYMKICTEKNHFLLPPRSIINRINFFANAEQLPKLTNEELKKYFGAETANSL